MRLRDRALGALLLVALAGCAPTRVGPLRLAPEVTRPAAGVPATPETLLVLSFDDGPSNERFPALGTNEHGLARTPTEAVLDVLRSEGIAAAFFVLTGPDTGFAKRRLEKGETELGFATLRRAAREGQLLACHWGGRYGSQRRGHPASLRLPAYDADGDGRVDRAGAADRTGEVDHTGERDRTGEAGSALESELLDCMQRVERAYTAEGRTSERVDFVRPPVWRFVEGAHDARPTYAALGLQMVLADERVPDGALPRGLALFGGPLVEGVVERVRRGEPQVLIALHDPNRRTAAGLPGLLKRLRERLAEEHLVEGVAWRFARDAGEVRAALRERDDEYRER